MTIDEYKAKTVEILENANVLGTDLVRWAPCLKNGSPAVAEGKMPLLRFDSVRLDEHEVTIRYRYEGELWDEFELTLDFEDLWDDLALVRTFKYHIQLAKTRRLAQYEREKARDVHREAEKEQRERRQLAELLAKYGESK